MKTLLRKLKLVIHDDFLVQLGEILGHFFSFTENHYPNFTQLKKKGFKFTYSTRTPAMPLWVMVIFTK